MHNYIDEIISNFNNYHKDGFLIRSFDKDLNIYDSEKVIEDYGDIIPYLYYFDGKDFSNQILNNILNSNYVKDGVYIKNGLIKIFYNHDWLMTFFEMYKLTGELKYLENLELGIKKLLERNISNGFLIDECNQNYRSTSLKSTLKTSSPYNLGLVEILSELGLILNKKEYIDKSTEFLNKVLNTQSFIRDNIFYRVNYTNRILLKVLPLWLSFSNSRLFKDNTNLIHAAITTYRLTNDEMLAKGIKEWTDGFKKFFFKDGEVFNDVIKGEIKNPLLKSSFSAIDVLLECIEVNINPKGNDELIRSIINFQKKIIMTNGLYPENRYTKIAHLDANVDFCVSLYKCGVIIDESFKKDALELKQSILERFRTPNGYVLYVDENNKIVDDRIIVKYQALLLKLFLLKEDLKTSDKEWDLLKDR